MKRHFCRFAEQGFDIFRILQAGQLNHDAVDALALNNRFFSTQFVNTASDDFNWLVDNLHFQLVQFDVAVFDFYLTVGVFRRLNAVVDFSEQIGRFVAGICIFDFDFYWIRAGVQVLIADFVLAQYLAGGIFYWRHPLFNNVVDFNFQQQVGTALQIQSQIDRLPPFRQGIGIADYVWNSKKDA